MASLDQQLLASLNVKVERLEQIVSDHAQRLDTLQTPLWKRLWFRIDGWPGQRDLNAERRAWRPWH
jgi:hypothetical protein